MKKYIGFLILVILLSGIIYISLPDKVKIRVDEDKTTFYVKNENNRWVVSGREYNKLFDGSSGMNRRASQIKIEVINTSNQIIIKRITPYIRGPVIVDTYEFDGKMDDVELFPISHTIEIINGTVCGTRNCIYQYEVRDLVYDGQTIKDVLSPQSFGRNMKVEWEDGNYYSRIYKYVGLNKGKLTIKYRIKSDYEKYEIRLFDPAIVTLDSPVDNYISPVKDIDFTCSVSEIVNNMSFLHNGTGNWIINQTVLFPLRDPFTYYKLNETSGTTQKDNIDGADDLTLTGYVGIPGGKIGRGYRPATTNCIVGAASPIDMQSLTEFSYQAWIKRTADMSGARHLMHETGNGNNNGDWIFFQVIGTNSFHSQTRSGANDPAGTINQFTFSEAPLNEWAHYVITINTTTIVYYMNGTQTGYTVPGDTIDLTNSQWDLTFWCHNAAGDKMDHTDWDEIALWDRVLTPEEVSSLWNDGDGLTIPSALDNTFSQSFDFTEPFDWTCSVVNDSNFKTFASENRTISIDDIFPILYFRASATTDNSWLNVSTIISNVNVNESFPSNITYNLYNVSDLINQTTFGMVNNLSNITFSWVDLLDGNYSFNVSVYDQGGRINYTEVRNTMIDTVFPLINYSGNSDITNTTGNFVHKDNVFINATVVELNEKNISFNLFTSTGTFNLSTFTDNRRSINFTGLSQNMYFWNVIVCDYADHCNTTETKKYGVEDNTFDLSGFTTNQDVELGTTLLANATNNLGIICVDIDHPAFGVNFSCGDFQTQFNLTIPWFYKNIFGNGEKSILVNPVGDAFNNTEFNITAHQYDEVVNLSLNISSNTQPRDVTFFECNSTFFDRVFNGQLIGDKIKVSNFTFNGAEGPDILNITFNNKGGVSQTFFLDDSAKIGLVNFTINVSGFNQGTVFEDNFNTTTFIDLVSSTAQVDLAGVIQAKNSSRIYNLFDEYDSSIGNNWFTDSGASSAVSETSTYIRASVDAAADGQSGTASAAVNPAQIGDTYEDIGMSLYTSDIIRFRVIGAYSGSENFCNSDGISIIEVGGVRVWNSTYLETASNAGEGYSSDVSFLLEKINQTSWQVNITGLETSTSSNWGGCISNPELFASAVFNWTDGTYSIDSNEASCSIAGTLINSFFISPDYLNEPVMKATSTGVTSVGCTLNYVRTDVYPINRSLYLRSNSSIISESVYSSVSIEKATFNIDALIESSETLTAFLSANGGVNWENVAPSVEHSFTNIGTDLRWMVNFTMVPEYKNVTSFIDFVNVTTPLDAPHNISFDFGDDGNIDYIIPGILNESSGSVTVELTNADISNAFTQIVSSYNHLFEVPLIVYSDSVGIVQLSMVNLTYDPNPVFLDNSAFQSCVSNNTNMENVTLVVGSAGGDINLSGLRYDYLGGNFTIETLAHNIDYSINKSINLTYFYSSFYKNLPYSWTDIIFFLPRSNSSKSVTAYGQTSITPLFNITTTNYGGRNMNLSIRVNESFSCLNLTYNYTGSSKPIENKINTSRKEFTTDLEYLNNTQIWFWADLNQCNPYDNRILRPKLEIESYCVGCLWGEL